MKNTNINAGLAVGLTAIAAMIVSCVGMISLNKFEACISMLAPVGVAFVIMLGNGWER